MAETLTAEDIKSIRAQYGLTQRSFALLLGIGTASMVRYEQGAQPTKANANLIRAARNPAFMAECLERDGGLISDKQRERATRCSYALISLDANNDERQSGKAKGKKPMNKMDEMYHYTLQQEVLNEQAANIACDMVEYLIQHHIDTSSVEHPVSILLGQLLELKRALITDAAFDDVWLEQARGHIRYLGNFVIELNRIDSVA